MLGPILFTAYVSPIGRLIGFYGINYHKYADDTQLYKALTVNPNACINRLESCSAGLQRWFCENDLLLNLDKSEVCFFGTRQKLRHADKPSSIKVAGCCIDVCEKPKILGVTPDSTLTFEDHINGVVRSCNFHIRALRHIRRHLTREVANTVACSIAGTRIDYCNGLFYGASEKYLEKLQRLHNKHARVMTNTGLRDYHSVDLLHELHWLPIRSWISFNVATLCRRALNNGLPTYLASKLIPYRPTRSLRSSDQDLLQEPSCRTKTGARRFSCSAPTVWNSMPRTLLDVQTISAFKTRLKTCLFDSTSVTK